MTLLCANCATPIRWQKMRRRPNAGWTHAKETRCSTVAVPRKMGVAV